jgi:hypothetical protein
VDRKFWIATAERAVKTVAQTLLSLWLVGDGVFNVLGVDWLTALGVGLGAGLVSVLMSLGGASLIGPVGSPSWVDEPGGAHRR